MGQRQQLKNYDILSDPPRHLYADPMRAHGWRERLSSATFNPRLYLAIDQLEKRLGLALRRFISSGLDDRLAMVGVCCSGTPLFRH